MTQVIWLGPTEYVTGDRSLRIEYPSVNHPGAIVTSKIAGDFKWISMSLRLPENATLEEVIVCYQVSHARSFISQLRLSEMGMPDHALVRHDDPTDLKSTTPARYSSRVPDIATAPGAATMLELRLNFQNTADRIYLGAVGVRLDLGRDIFNVKTYGALGDGRADDTDAVVAAIAAVTAAGGGTIYFPSGTFMVSPDRLFLQCNDVVWEGAGIYRTTVRGRTGGGQLFQAANGTASNVTFRDLTFDASLNISAFALYGSSVRNVTWQNCRWYPLGLLGVFAQQCLDMTFEGCEFRGQGWAGGTGIQLSQGGSNVTIRNCKFFYINSGVVIDTGNGASADEALAEHVTVDSCTFDLAWWLIRPTFSGSGATLTYEVTALVDTAANFNGLNEWDTVRCMPVRSSGTLSSWEGTRLTDNVATFVTAGVKRGEIVRAGSVWGIISGVESQTTIRVEGWLDSDTWLPVLGPATGAYIVYKVLIGQVGTAVTATRIPLHGAWFDLDGDRVLTGASIPAGSLYEVCHRPNYALHCEAGGRRINVTSNTFRRGWSDQISLYGNDSLVVANSVSDGEDIGITVNGWAGGGHSLIANNKIHHQGAGGIWCTSENAVIVGNVCVASQWVNEVNTKYLAGIMGLGKNQLIVSNLCDGQGKPQAHHGICVDNDGQMAVNNRCTGHKLEDIVVFKSAVNTRLRDNVGAIGHLFDTGSEPEGQDYGVLDGTEPPEGAVKAGIGTLFRDKTNGNLFIKRAGTGSTGWAQLAMVP